MEINANSISNNAYAGLQIADAGMLVTSENVTGSSVKGFDKRTANVTLDQLAPNSLALDGTSFAVDGFTRAYSDVIGSQLLVANANSTYSDTLVQYTQSLDSTLADQNTGLTSSLSTFFNAMGTYAADPTSQASAAAITSSANNVATSMAGMSSITNQMLSDSQAELASTVKQVNTLLPQLASINAQIVAATSPGTSTPSADLLDQRDQILTNLQQLVGGQSLINGDGTATQLVDGVPLVERSIANSLDISPNQSAISVVYNSKNATTGVANSQNLQTIDGGQAGALLNIINNFVPSVEQNLNSIAMGLVEVANSAATQSNPSPTLVGLQSGQMIGSQQKVTLASVASGTATGDYQIVTSENGTSLGAGRIALKEPDGSYINPVNPLVDGVTTAPGQLVNFGNGIQIELQDTNNASPQTAASIATALSGTSFSVTLPSGGTNLPIFGFKVGNAEFASLQQGSTDPTGNLPAITSDADLANLYNSLQNVITSPLTANGGVTVGSFSKVSSIYADTTKAAPNGYTLSQVENNGVPTNQITLTPNPVNGVQGQSQTVSIPNSTLGGTQSIDFSQYGISINVSNPSNYVNTGVIGLYSGQAIGNQSVTSVSASGTLANGGYQIVTNTGSALPAGEIALEKPDGTYTSPITVAAGSSGGQLLNFGDGIKIELADNGAGDSASTIANSLNGTTFTVGMHAGSVLTNGETIQNINANTSAQPGTYQLSTDNNGNLTLTANINGSSVSQTIALSNLAANSSQSIDFNNLGISFAINNGSTQLSAQQLAQDLVGSSPTNQLVIAPGIDTGLDLATSLGQSGQNTIDVTGQTNAALAYGLTANNFVSLAPSDPAQYMNGTTPYISSAAANAVSAMGSVFGDAVSNMTSDVGSQIATWKNDQTANTAVLNNLQSQNDSISGVNLDEEAANLLKYQQLYSASSKVLQAGNDMFTALIGIMS